ncbi:MAG TPA: hypothetical protein ENI23_04770, partial [bacterium]|nr:hypothetical protein [bacterium]
MITTEQVTDFLASNPIPEDVEPFSQISWVPPIEVRDKLEARLWNTNKIESAKKSLNRAIGIDNLITPAPIEQQNRLNFWWRDEGQFIPRNVLDQMGIVGGEKVPTLQESLVLGRKQKIGAVKDFLAIKRPQNKDPLDDLLVLPEVADPRDVPDPLKVIEPKMADIIKASTVEDLGVIRNVVVSNPLDFEEGLLRTIDDEIKIKKTIPDIIELMADKPLTILLGTDFFNKLAFNLPEFTSRKGLSPTENLLDLPKGSESIFIRSVARVREMLAEEDPRLLTRIGLESGGIVADLIKFSLIPDPSKARVFASLSPAVKAAIGVGTKAGLVQLLQAPEPEETFDERVNSVVLSVGIGALTGALLSKAITFIKDIPVNQQASRLVKKFPQIKQNEWVEILKAAKENRLLELRIKPPIEPARRIVPKGFRAAFAEIEKPAKLVGKVAKQVPKVKEALAVTAAKKVLALKIQPAKAVKPTRILTKKESLSLQKSNLITGEGEKIRIVADTKTQRLLQTKENEIAKLKTRRNELLAQKQFAVAKTKAQEIAKKEIALETLKEKAGIKLEQTIEGSKVKIAKIREATEFKESLRNDAVSMITAIPKELRTRFINRANKVKTLKGLQKLTDEVEAGIENFERKLAAGDLRQTIKELESKNRRGKVRLGKIPSPQRERLIEIIDEISIKRISTELEP